QSVGPATLAPNRNFTFPDTPGLDLKDLNPKLSAAYDLNGNGKTALKVSLNRNVEPYTVGGIAGANNPIVRLATTTTRSWTDANSDYVPDCNLIVLTANGECGAVANTLFGSAGAQANFDPDVLRGWGKRLYNWEFFAGVQRQPLTGLSVDAISFLRWYGNFTIIDNRSVTASDFTEFNLNNTTQPGPPVGRGLVTSR